MAFSQLSLELINDLENSIPSLWQNLDDRMINDLGECFAPISTLVYRQQSDSTQTRDFRCSFCNRLISAYSWSCRFTKEKQGIYQFDQYCDIEPHHYCIKL